MPEWQEEENIGEPGHQHHIMREEMIGGNAKEIAWTHATDADKSDWLE